MNIKFWKLCVLFCIAFIVGNILVMGNDNINIKKTGYFLSIDT